MSDGQAVRPHRSTAPLRVILIVSGAVDRMFDLSDMAGPRVLEQYCCMRGATYIVPGSTLWDCLEDLSPLLKGEPQERIGACDAKLGADLGAMILYRSHADAQLSRNLSAHPVVGDHLEDSSLCRRELTGP